MKYAYVSMYYVYYLCITSNEDSYICCIMKIICRHCIQHQGKYFIGTMGSPVSVNKVNNECRIDNFFSLHHRAEQNFLSDHQAGPQKVRC